MTFLYVLTSLSLSSQINYHTIISKLAISNVKEHLLQPFINQDDYSLQFNQMQLSDHTISTMISQKGGLGDKFIVQAFKVKKSDEFLKFSIRDKSESVKALIEITKPQLNILQICQPSQSGDTYLIKVSQFQCHTKGDKVVVKINNFLPVQKKKIEKVIQAPQMSPKSKNQQKEAYFDKTQKKQSSKGFKLIIDDDSEPIEPAQKQIQSMDDERLAKYQLISDLQPNFYGRWQIVVRILDKTYREFYSKDNRYIKLLKLLLVDRKGMKIQGVMFGDSALELSEYIKVDHVYRISKGQVTNTDKKNNAIKPKDHSPFSINFTRNTQFIPIMNVKSIPEVTQEGRSVAQILKEQKLDVEYNIIAILLQIYEGKQMQREDKTIFKRSIIIGDPIKKISIQVVIWNKQLQINPDWLNKTIYLKNFKLKQFKQSLCLNSVYASEIKLAHKSKLADYEGKLSSSQYQAVAGSSSKRDKEEQDQQMKITNIKQVFDILESGQSSQVYSELELWLTYINLRNKWYYMSCSNSKCKKTAQPDAQCIYCGHMNNSIKPRFMIPLTLSDFTGSLFATAFEEVSQQIFKGVSINTLIKMDENQLLQIADSKLYQSMRFKISSKKDSDGNIKHNIVGKSIPTTIDQSSALNIHKIHQLLQA